MHHPQISKDCVFVSVLYVCLRLPWQLSFSWVFLNSVKLLDHEFVNKRVYYIFTKMCQTCVTTVPRFSYNRSSEHGSIVNLKNMRGSIYQSASRPRVSVLHVFMQEVAKHRTLSCDPGRLESISADPFTMDCTSSKSTWPHDEYSLVRIGRTATPLK